MPASALIDPAFSATTGDSSIAYDCEELEYRIATTPRERISAFQLIYERYLAAELIHANDFGLRVTPYQLLPTTTVYIARQRGRTMCTVTLIGDGEMGLPMESLYPDEVNERRSLQLSVGEVSCLAFEAMSLNRFLYVFMQLTRLMAQHARANGMDQFLIAVHPQHARFYQRFMGFEQVGPLKAYPTVCDAPAVACCLDFAAIDRARPKCYQAYFGSKIPASELVSHPLTSKELRFLKPISAHSHAPLPACVHC